MSRSRLCVRISNCSRDFLSTCGERSTVQRLIAVGRSTGPATRRTGAPHGLDDLLDGPVQEAVVVGPQANPDLLIGQQRPRRYSTISVTTPAPTVRPPSRIANRSSFSIAIGVISSTAIATLSPGITISTPAGNVHTPVTSVVRK